MPGCFPTDLFLLRRCFDPPLLFKWRYDLEDEWGNNPSPRGRIDFRWRGLLAEKRTRPTITRSRHADYKKRNTLFSIEKRRSHLDFRSTVRKRSLISEIRTEDSWLLIQTTSISNFVTLNVFREGCVNFFTSGIRWMRRITKELRKIL